jgi:3-methylfumaryl-CoA hydratase
MANWDGWLGRGEKRRDRVDEGLVERWYATLNREPPESNLAPQSIHWCLCVPNAAGDMLGPDGHPQNSDNPHSYFPPLPLPRRMWAGSEILFHAPLRIGQQVRRKTAVKTIAEKSGSTGPLTFVQVEHDTFADEALAIREIQTIVYREAVPEGSPLAPAPLGAPSFDPSTWAYHAKVCPVETMLFRYSALTFNSHRIHYDYPYARDVEGYRGLVVQGPLTATLLMDACQQYCGHNSIRKFAFRGVSPAICHENINLVIQQDDTGMALSAYCDDGRLIMTAEAEVEA